MIIKKLSLAITSSLIACIALLSSCQRPAQTVAEMRVPQAVINNWSDYFNSVGINMQQYGWSLRLIIPADRLFHPGKNKLTSDAPEILNKISDILATYTSNTDNASPIQIVGYTDNIPSRSQSKHLAHQQAQVVASFLWHHGISTKHLRVLNPGRIRPISNPHSMYGKYKNRRIEIIVN